MLSSAGRKLRFWKKQPDKKKELTAEDDALLNEIEQQSKIINNLKQECARLHELKTDLQQYKARHEVLERKTVQQAQRVEKQQSKLQASLKMAEEEIEKLSEQLKSLRNAACNKCELKMKEQKRYSLEICHLQETIVRLESENRILQSLVQEYTSKASKYAGKMQQSFFSIDKQPQNPGSSDPGISTETTKSVTSARHESMRRSSLSLNDFLDDSVDDIQSEKLEADKSSGCSSLDEDQKELYSGSDRWEDRSSKSTEPTSPKEDTKSEGSLSAGESFKLFTLESLMPKSKQMINSESFCETSDVFSSTNFSSVTSNSLHDLTSATSTENKTHFSETETTETEKNKLSSSLKNLSSLSEQEAVIPTLTSYASSNISPYLCLEGTFARKTPKLFDKNCKRTKKRRSLDDPKTLAKIYLQNKSDQTDLQKAINFFRSTGNNEAGRDGNSKNIVITKDRVAALKRYFEGKSTNVSFQISEVDKSEIIVSKTKISQNNTNNLTSSGPKNRNSENKQKLNSIPRITALPRIAKAKNANINSQQLPNNSTSDRHRPPSSPNLISRQSRDVRSASVPSPTLPNKCKESPQFKIAFTKSTSLRSFNNFALNNRPARPDKPVEVMKSKKICVISKNSMKIHLKPAIITDIDKYKLNCQPNLGVLRENVSNSDDAFSRSSPVVVVDVSEDTSDTYISNDELTVDSCSPQSSTSLEKISKNTSSNKKPHNTKSVGSKQSTKSPLKIPNVATCNCRTKAQAIKEENICKPIKPKASSVRTNGSMVQKVSPPSPYVKTSTPERHKTPEIINKDINQANRFLVQKDDPDTNQTFFYEVSSQEKNSMIPTRKSPVHNNLKTSNSPARACRTTSSRTPDHGVGIGSFSPEKFMLKPGQSGHQSLPNDQFNLDTRFNNPSSHLQNKPLQNNQTRDEHRNKSSRTRQEKSLDPKRPNLTPADKNLVRVSKTNSPQISSVDVKPPKVDVRGYPTKLKKADKIPRARMNKNAAKDSAKGAGKNAVGPNHVQSDLEFEEISRQLDNLTLTVNNMQTKHVLTSIM